jgi:hypothetical protein
MREAGDFSASVRLDGNPVKSKGLPGATKHAQTASGKEKAGVSFFRP